jgi:hypothetical protein
MRNKPLTGDDGTGDLRIETAETEQRRDIIRVTVANLIPSLFATTHQRPVMMRVSGY